MPACGGDAGPGGLLDGVHLRNQHAGAGEIPAERRCLAAGVVHHREHLERPGIAGELDSPRTDLQTAVVVPEEVRCPGRQPTPPQHLGRGDLSAGEGGDPAPEGGRSQLTAPR